MDASSPSTQIHTPASWLDPIDWSAVFNQAQPIEVDIGCGKGAFLLWAAQARPQHNFLGIERLLLRLRKVDKKVRRLGLRNVRFIRLEAGYFVSHLIPPASVSVYHISFPDPWPKRRHFHKRLVNAEFAAALERTLASGGAVNVATDHEGYFQQMERVLGAVATLRRESPEALPPEAQTDFEKQFLAANRSVHRARWCKSL